MENTEAGSRPAQGIGHPGAASDPGGAPGRKPTLDIRYVVAAIRSNLGLIGLSIGGVLAVTIIMTLLQVPTYTAKSTLQINSSGARVLNGNKDSDVDTSEDSGGSDTDRFLKTQVDILKSRGMAFRVAQKLKLFTDPHFFEAAGAAPPLPDASPVVVHDSVQGMLTSRLSVELPRDSRILSISFVSSDPQLAAAIANAYGTEFIQANLQRRFDSSAYARDFLSNQLTEVKQRLEESERALNTYSRSAGLIRTSNGGDDKNSSQSMSVTTSSLLQLNQSANEAMADPSWSPDGRYLAFSSTRGYNSRIYLLMVSNRKIISALTEGNANDSCPAWSGWLGE